MTRRSRPANLAGRVCNGKMLTVCVIRSRLICLEGILLERVPVHVFSDYV